MGDFVANGILGSIILVGIIGVVYVIATKKSPWNLPTPTQGLEGWKWPLVAIGVVAVLFTVVWLQSPSLATVTTEVQNRWLTIIILAGVISLLLLFFVKENAATLQKALWGTVAVLLIGFPVGTWVMSSSWSSGCVSGHPCVLSQYDDGSSEHVSVPRGKVACFDPWIWQRFGDLGLMISHQAAGTPEMSFPCSVKEVLGGSCTAVYDQFWFKPAKKETRLPNYWFVATGSKQC